MAIALEFHDNIQFINLEGNFGRVEESALRLKLDQKFSQGRTLFVFKLEKFAFDNAESVATLTDLLGYFTKLGAWIGLTGMNNQQMSLLQGLYKKQCKGFGTDAEAKKWILEESQKPKDKNPEKVTDDDIKRTEINILIQSYATTFIEKDQDTYRISKLGFEYNSTPNADFLQAIKNVLHEKDRIEVEIQKRETEIDLIEKTLIDFMNLRKLPASEAEIKSQTKVADAKNLETDNALKELNDEMNVLKDRVQKAKSQAEARQTEWRTKIEKAEQELTALKNGNATVEEDYKKREAAENAELQKLRPGAS